MKKLLLALLAGLFLTSFVTAVVFDKSLKFELQSPPITSLTNNPNATYTHTNSPINFSGLLPLFVEVQPTSPVPIKKIRVYMHTLHINGRPPLSKPGIHEIRPGYYPAQKFQELNPYHNTVANMFPQWGNISTIFNIDGIVCEIDVVGESISKCTNFVSGLLNNHHLHPEIIYDYPNGRFKYLKKTYSFTDAKFTFDERLSYPLLFGRGFYYVPWLTNIAVLFPWGQYKFYSVAELSDGNYVVSNIFTAEALEPGTIGGNNTCIGC